MWKRYVSISLGLGGSIASVLGQGVATTSPSYVAPAAQPTQIASQVPTGGMLESNTFLEMSDRVFNPNSDSLDFEEGSFNWKGRSFNLADQRAFRARFERFLLSTPSKESAEYAALMREIMDRLSVANSNNDETIQETWQLLFVAGEFDQDGGNSVVVANQVFNAWRIRKESRGTAMSQIELEELRRNQQEVVANRERMIRKLKERRERETSVETRKESAEAEGEGEIAGEAAFRALDLAETEAKLTALEARAAATGLQAKLQFQSQIVAFLTQRRFQHALLLSGFYQLLFKGSHQQLEVNSDELSAFFPNSDLSFTVDTLSYVSREAINDIDTGVEAITVAYNEGRKLVALERMQEIFFLGEYMPELDTISVVARREFLDLYRGMLEARELAEAKDYASVLEQAKKLGAIARDFPESRVIASVESAMSMSDMAVFAASQYRNIGEIDKAREELRNAIEIWPSNPSIRDFQRETTQLATAGSQGERVFDDLMARNDFRGIYERRMELGFGLAADTERKPQLMAVIDQVAKVDMLIAQARELDKQGERYAAWELLETARKIDSDDAPMNRALAELAPRVANFIGAVDKAQKHEANGEYAAALSAYMIAQDIYPASRICRIGIEVSANGLMRALAAENVVD